MEKSFREQLRRIDRLLAVINSADQLTSIGDLDFEDVLMFTCQCMWHLKDWIQNDSEFYPKDPIQLIADIHSSHALRICADLANGSKHAKLARPKVGARIADQSGMHLEPSKGIYQVFYYVKLIDDSDPLHWMEIRSFLELCRETWTEIIDKHYLSGISFSLGA